MIGIIGAMDIEVSSIVAAMTDCEKHTISGIPFVSGKLSGVPAVIAKCGIGKVSAAVCAQILISVFRVDKIINTGVAGGLAPELRQGDIVISSGLVEHDMDTTPLGDAPGYLSGLDIVTLPCDDELAEFAAAVSEQSQDYHTVRGIIATGDQFIANRERSDYIRSTFNAAACEMEGGAIAHVCYMAGVPFVAVRCISDNADGAAGMSYADFSVIAAERCAGLVLELFRRIS